MASRASYLAIASRAMQQLRRHGIAMFIERGTAHLKVTAVLTEINAWFSQQIQTSIQQGDRMAITSVDVTPLVSDKLLCNGYPFQFIEVIAIAPGGVDVIYMALVR